MFISGAQIEKSVRFMGLLLDKTYELDCSCGWHRDLGYMWATAEHLYQVHKEQFPTHNLDMIVREAKPLPQVVIERKMAKRKRRNTVHLKALT